MWNIIHEGYWGMAKCKARARQLLYWPGMVSHINDVVLACEVFIKLQSKKRKESLCPHEIPNRLWERLGTKILEF